MKPQNSVYSNGPLFILYAKSFEIVWLPYRPTYLVCLLGSISSVSNQNGVSLLYIMLEIHRSGREPSIFTFVFCLNIVTVVFCSEDTSLEVSIKDTVFVFQ